MLCKDAEELIKNYKLGSITADNFLLLVQHTEECPKCKALFDAVENTKEQSSTFFRGLARFYKRFDSIIREKQKQKKIYTRKSFYFSLIILFLALAALSLFKVLNFNFSNIYLVISGFLTISSITAIFMLISIEE